MSGTYWVLAYYHLTELEDPCDLVQRHLDFFEGRDVSSRIYISEQGINGQMSAEVSDAQAYMEWLRSEGGFSEVEFKIHKWHRNVFPRVTVKYRRQLVAMDCEVNPDEGAEHVSPQQWREMLESDKPYLKIDVRNDYEWELGHFEGFEKPEAKTFRDFPDWTERLKQQHDPQKTEVMICCTGGIRCEFYGPLLKKAGFEKVYQLQGGIIKYGEEEHGKHWKGKLFVFDDRLGIEVNPEEKEAASACGHCGEPTDHIANCANVECNELFICCLDCLAEHTGCCSSHCMEAPRLRNYRDGIEHPFRRLHLCRSEQS